MNNDPSVLEDDFPECGGYAKYTDEIPLAEDPLGRDEALVSDNRIGERFWKIEKSGDLKSRKIVIE